MRGQMSTFQNSSGAADPPWPASKEDLDWDAVAQASGGGSPAKKKLPSFLVARADDTHHRKKRVDVRVDMR